MNQDKIFAIFFCALGVLSGLISCYLKELTISIFLPLIIFSISFYLLVKFAKYSKVKKLLLDSVITFALVWLVTWIVLIQ